jgi:hypothetical protein
MKCVEELPSRHSLLSVLQFQNGLERMSFESAEVKIECRLSSFILTAAVACCGDGAGRLDHNLRAMVTHHSIRVRFARLRSSGHFAVGRGRGGPSKLLV